LALMFIETVKDGLIFFNLWDKISFISYNFNKIDQLQDLCI
jgi:hypothetical protein